MHMEIRSSEFVRYQVKVGERQTSPAGVRGDDAEQQRLDRSAPKQLFHVPAHRGYVFRGNRDRGGAAVASGEATVTRRSGEQ